MLLTTYNFTRRESCPLLLSYNPVFSFSTGYSFTRRVTFRWHWMLGWVHACIYIHVFLCLFFLGNLIDSVASLEIFSSLLFFRQKVLMLLTSSTCINFLPPSTKIFFGQRLSLFHTNTLLWCESLHFSMQRAMKLLSFRVIILSSNVYITQQE